MVSLEKRRGRHGLTLAEVLFALAIIASVVLVVVGVFAGGIHLMNRSEKRTQASNLGGDLLEQIADEGGFSHLPDVDRVFDGRVPDAPDTSGFPPSPYPASGDYTVVVTTRVLTGVTRAVLVEVHWDSGAVKLEKVFHAVE